MSRSATSARHPAGLPATAAAAPPAALAASNAWCDRHGRYGRSHLSSSATAMGRTSRHKTRQPQLCPTDVRKQHVEANSNNLRSQPGHTMLSGCGSGPARLTGCGMAASQPRIKGVGGRECGQRWGRGLSGAHEVAEGSPRKPASRWGRPRGLGGWRTAPAQRGCAPAGRAGKCWNSGSTSIHLRSEFLKLSPYLKTVLSRRRRLPWR